MRKLLVSALVLAMVTSFAGMAFAASTTRLHVFSDVTNEQQAYYLNFLGSLGYFRGDTGPGGPARPNDTLTRAEFAVVVVRMLGKEGLATMMAGFTPPFSDAATIPGWAVGAINVLVNLDILRGNPDGTLRPNDSVTGAEAIAMLTRALQNDKAVSGVWPMNYLTWAYENGLIDPLADITSWKFIAPIGPITRAQMAFLTYNALWIERGWNPAATPAPDFTLPSLIDSIAARGIVEGYDLANSKVTIDGFAVDLASVVTLYGGANLDAFLYRAVMVAFDTTDKVVWLGTDPGAVVTGVFEAWVEDTTTTPSKWYIELTDGRKVQFVPDTGGTGTTKFRVNGGALLTYKGADPGGVEDLDVANASLTIVLDDSNVATYVTVFKEDFAVCYVTGKTTETDPATPLLGTVTLAGDVPGTLNVTTATKFTGAVASFADLKAGDLVYVASVGMARSDAYAIDTVKNSRQGIIDEVWTGYPSGTVTVEFKTGSPVVLSGVGGATYYGDTVSNANKDQEWVFWLDRAGKAVLGNRVAGAVAQYPLVKIIGYEDRTKDRITVQDYTGATFTFTVGSGDWTSPDAGTCEVFDSTYIGLAGELRIAGRAEAESKTSGSDIAIGDVIGWTPITTTNYWGIWEIYAVNTATGELTIGNSGSYYYFKNPQALVYEFAYGSPYEKCGARVGMAGLKVGDILSVFKFDPTGAAVEELYLLLKFVDRDKDGDIWNNVEPYVAP
jgi:hypothetical protein